MTDLPIWECLYRIRVLNHFISYLYIYRNHSEFSGRRGRGPSFASNENGLDARKSINLLTAKVSKYLLESGNYPLVNYREPPAVGGRMISNIDIIQNIFRLSDFEIPIQTVVDWVQKGAGYYRDDLIKSLFRTINPFWWLWKLVKAIIRIPFEIFGWAGFDSGKLEATQGGKLYKAVAGLVAFIVALAAFIASIVQILDSFDMIQPLKDFLRGLFR